MWPFPYCLVSFWNILFVAQAMSKRVSKPANTEGAALIEPIELQAISEPLLRRTMPVPASCFAGAANAADQVVKAFPGPTVPYAVAPVQDCSAFYDDYRRRGFVWGSGPGASLGFGTFEGALPRYPINEFPNWYGECVNWGHYSASGSALQ